MTQLAALRTLRGLEARLLMRRSHPPEVAAAVRDALAAIHTDGPPADIAKAGAAIAEAVEAHGARFPPGAEPAYHDRHHQAEATLAAGFLAAAALRGGEMAPRAAWLLVLAMAGHDLLHEGRPAEGEALERRSAARTEALATALPPEERAILARLILATAPAAAPPDLPARMAREADLFASLTPDLGPRLSRALAAEWRAAGVTDMGTPTTHAGRCALLQRLPAMTPPARALGLEAVRSLQLEALSVAGETEDPAEGARRLDAMPPAAAAARWAAALASLGLPELPA